MLHLTLVPEKSAEVVIPGCLVAALISAFLQLESLRRVQQRAIASEIGDNCLPTGSCEVVNVSYELSPAQSVMLYLRWKFVLFYTAALLLFFTHLHVCAQDKSELTSLLVTEGFSDFSVQTKKDIPVLEIRIGQVIITTVLLCIILLACRNSSHRIGLSIAVGVLIGEHLLPLSFKSISLANIVWSLIRVDVMTRYLSTLKSLFLFLYFYTFQPWSRLCTS